MPFDGEVQNYLEPKLVPLDEQIIQRAREIIERGWTQGALARSADGFKVSPVGSLAVSFCLHGAVRRAANELGTYGSSGCTGTALAKIANRIIHHAGRDGRYEGLGPSAVVVQFNDSAPNARTVLDALS